MTIKVNESAFVSATAATIGLSAMFATPAATNNPAYVVVTALDRNEYTAGASGATGSFSGNGHTATFTSQGGDARGAGMVFAYQAATGRYYSSVYGYLDQLQYNSSSSAGDVTNISLFGTSNLSLANQYAANAEALMQVDNAGYIGSATVVTQSGATGTVPTQATPNSIAAAADAMVGKAWNMNGCWTLASTIAADAGAALPVQSTAVGLPGQASGEWIVAFDGPAGQSGNWQSLVTTGDIVVIGTSGGSGHITTCVSGTGGTAMLVDNVTYENSAGKITNAANDGSASDVLIAAPHAAAQEFAGVQASTVVIYQLDVPTVTAKSATDSVAAKATQALSALFSATDPGNKAITEYQIYDTSSAGGFTVNGVSQAAHSATSALTLTSLSSTNYVAGASSGSDTIEIRAFNGSYWNDWGSLAVSVTSPAAPPVVSTQTAAQTWVGGAKVSFALPANTFSDPQGQKLTFTATQSNGQALPSWLSFNAATDSFSGTAPITAATLGLKVTATDTSGLSVADSFIATVVPPGPVLANQTAAVKETSGTAFSFALPANTFTDAGSASLSYVASQLGGPNATGWLHFNGTTDTFSGTAPAGTSGTIQLQVVATDGNKLSATDRFSLSYAPSASSHLSVANMFASVTSPVVLHS